MNRLIILLASAATLTLAIPCVANAQSMGEEGPPRVPYFREHQGDDHDPSVELERRFFREQEDGASLRGVCMIQTVPSEADGSPTRVQICH